MDKGTTLILLPQPSCPATLVSIAHLASDFLQSARLLNASENVLIGFRLGWIVAKPARKTEVHFGKRVRLEQGIGPNDTCTIPAQEVIVDKQRTVSACVAFFIAEVFLREGQPWKADLKELESEARNYTRN
jgi:hypothetical protein